MTEKLLPCPFCGGEAAVRDIKEPSANGWIGCQSCRCFIDWVKNGKPQAITAWNRRADHLPDATKMVSNADRIRGMSDGELAELIYSFEDLKAPDYCQRKKECDDMLDSDTDIPAEKCIGCLLDWRREGGNYEH